MGEDSVTTSRGHVFTLRSINEALDREYPGARIVLEVDRHGTLTRAYVGSPDGQPVALVTPKSLAEVVARAGGILRPDDPPERLAPVDSEC